MMCQSLPDSPNDFMKYPDPNTLCVAFSSVNMLWYPVAQ